MYVERVKAEGATVLVARDGEEALAQVRDNHPHAIILDIMMPKMNGLDVLRALYEDSSTKNIPVVILTALDDQEKRRVAAEYGAADYIVKSESLPVDVIEKLKTILI